MPTIRRQRQCEVHRMSDNVQPAYAFTIRPLEADEGGGYLIEFPDLPGCMADGETVEEAIR